MFNQDEGKIECEVGNSEICFWQDKRAENVLILFVIRGIYLSLDYWYCQIQTSRLIMFLHKNY